MKTIKPVSTDEMDFDPNIHKSSAKMSLEKNFFLLMFLLASLKNYQ
jgi:hypothetical protein